MIKNTNNARLFRYQFNTYLKYKCVPFLTGLHLQQNISRLHSYHEVGFLKIDISLARHILALKNYEVLNPFTQTTQYKRNRNIFRQQNYCLQENIHTATENYFKLFLVFCFGKGTQHLIVLHQSAKLFTSLINTVVSVRH